MGKRSVRVLSALAVAFAAVFSWSMPGAATIVPAPVGDGAVRIPGTPYPDNGDDSGILVQIDNDYILSRTAGDDPLTVETAAQQRATAANAAIKIKSGGKPTTTTFSGAWTPIGPNPIEQIQRSDGALTPVSGRVGALAIRKNGRFILGGAQGGIWTMDPGTNSWVPRTDNLTSLATGALEVAPSNDLVVYDGTGEGALSGDSYTGNGILKSTDGGTTWSHVSGDFFVGVSIARLAIDPTDENHLYAAVLRGRGGAHRTSPIDHSAFGLWESKDGGVNWTLRMAAPTGSLGATDLRIDPITPNVLYASFLGDAIYKSTDSGATWTPFMSGMPAGANFAAVPTRFNIALSHPAGKSPVLYAGFDWFNSANPPPGTPGGPNVHRASRIFKSVDGGAWARADVPHNPLSVDDVVNYCDIQCTYDNVIEADPNNPNVVFAGGSYGYNNTPQSGGIFRSDDGGVNWKNLGWDQHPDFHSAVFDPNNSQHVLIGSDGGVWYSADQGGRAPGSANEGDLTGQDWVDLNGSPSLTSDQYLHQQPAISGNGLQISQFSSIQANPTRTPRFWGGTQDNGTLREVAGVPTWIDMTSGDGGNAQVDPTDWHYIYGTYFAPPTQIYRITDGGTFIFNNPPITNGINVNERAEFYMPLVLNQENPNQLFTGTFHVYRTDNAKAPSSSDVHWSSISGDLTSGCIGPAPNGARNCTLTSIGVGGGTGVYAGTNDGLLWVSPDGQTSGSPTWIRLGAGSLPNRPVSGIAVDRSDWRIAYVAYNGFDAATPTAPGHVFKTTDGGQTFQNITSNLPDTPVNWLIVDPAYRDTIYAATDVGPFVTFNGGANWFALGTGFPIVGVDQLSLDTFHRTLVAGTHGRGAWKIGDVSAPAPAPYIHAVDAGVPVGPGSLVDYTITVTNIGNADAGHVHIQDPIPANTTFVSADNGGTFSNGVVDWTGLTVPADVPTAGVAANPTPTSGGGKVTVHLRVQINPNLSSGVTSIVNDGMQIKTAQDVKWRTGSPVTTPIAPAYSVSIAPASQIDGARVGHSVNYQLTLTNHGFKNDSYTMSASGGTFPVSFFAADCTTPQPTTPSVGPGGSTTVCARVDVPATAADSSTSTATVTATSAGSSSVTASASIKTIAVAVDTLLVDDDGFVPSGSKNVDVNKFYTDAMTANSIAFQLWDLSSDKNLPLNYLKSFKHVVWFTGNSFPSPLGPYEAELKSYLDGGGHLFVSAQDYLDQTGGTTSFVHDYLHITWNDATMNDQFTAHVTGVASTLAASDGTVAINDTILANDFMDEIQPNAPAQAIFTDDAGKPDALQFNGGAGSYKVVFLGFPMEEYGVAADQAKLIGQVFNFFNS